MAAKKNLCGSAQFQRGYYAKKMKFKDLLKLATKRRTCFQIERRLFKKTTL